MKEPRVFVRLMLLLSFLFSGFLSGAGAHSAAAQGGATSYDSPVTGASIRTTGPWTIDTGSIESSSNMEMVLLYGQYDGMLISFLPAGTDLVMARDIFLEEFSSVFGTFVPIDRGSYGNVSYSLDITSSEGIEFGVFSLFLGQRESGYVEYYLYFGPVLYFQQGFASAQQNVTVNGAAVFDGVDGGGLQGLLAANAGVTGASTEKPDENVVDAGPTEAPALAPEVAPTPPDAPVPPADAPVDDGEAGAAYIATIESELVYLETTLLDFTVNFGEISGDSSDAAIGEINRIASEWLAYPDQAATIVAPPGYEDIHASYQAVAGQVGELAEAWYGVVDIIGAGDQAATSQAIVEFFDMLVALQDEIEALQADVAGLSQVAQPTAVPTEPPAIPTPRPTEAAPEPTEESVDLTGEDEPRGKSSTGVAKLPDPDEEDAQEVVSNETETGRGGQGPDLSEYEDLGLLDEGQYVSPQFDVEVTWEDTWLFASHLDEPITSDEDVGTDSVTISWAGDGGAVIFVTLADSGGEVTPEAIGEHWTSDEYLSDVLPSGGELLQHDVSRSGAAAVLIHGYLDDGTEVIVLREAMCADARCDTLAISMMVANPDSFADAYADARGDIRVDGERLIGVFSVRDIESATNE